MTAADHLSPHQFMDVRELLNTQSNDALVDKQRRLKDYNAPPGPDTTVRAVYDQRAKSIAANPKLYRQLDEHLRSGDIDPVLMASENGGPPSIYEGHHRIVRATQIGVKQLPVSYSEDSQTHRDSWLDAEGLDTVQDAYWQNRRK